MKKLKKIWDNILSALIVVLFSAFCFFFATWPEFGMYGLWHLINPPDALTKIMLVALFFFGGGALCLLFGLMGIAMWLKFITEVL